MNKPDFLITGVQRAGTTSLHYYLKQHNSLYGSYPKELNYFNKEINHGKTLDWYFSYFKKSKHNDNVLFFETTPNYIYREHCAENIKNVLPDVKLVVILREPVERAFSAWTHFKEIFKTGKIHQYKKKDFSTSKQLYNALMNSSDTFPSFKECIKIEMDILNDSEKPEPSFLRRGLYCRQIKTYLKYFKRDKILILGYKELVTNTVECLNKVLNFLGLDKSDWTFLKKEIKNAGKYNESLRDEEREILEDFYFKPNGKLFNLIDKINW